MQLNFKIDQFEGPLDLLLTLISKHKMNILDIEIITIINQYLEIINAAQAQDLDIASDFIDMAARLVYLKSVYLLPKDEEGEKLPLQRAAGRCKAVQRVFQCRRFRAGAQKTKVSRASREPASKAKGLMES